MVAGFMTLTYKCYVKEAVCFNSWFSEPCTWSKARIWYLQRIIYSNAKCAVQGNHWCTIAGTSASVVYVYDSLLTYLPEDAKMQIAGIICSQKTTIECKLHEEQNQQGACDCGLFAIAFATDLAYGNEPASYATGLAYSNEPASYKYDQTKLRQPFLDCLSKNIMTSSHKTPLHYKKPHVETIKTFCKMSFS